MILEICAILFIVIFGVLAFFAIRTLLAVQHSLRTLDQTTHSLTSKLNNLDSTFRTISHLGDVCEFEAANWKKEAFQSKEESHGSNYSRELADWLVISLRLAEKFLRRR